MGDAVRVLIVDDDDLVRHALRAFLANDDRVMLVGEANDGSEVVEACQALSPDVVLMDIKMQNVSGAVATRLVIEWNPCCRVVALTTITTEWRALEVLRAGACGYLLKNSTPSEIINAVMAAYAGDQVFSPATQTKSMKESIESDDPPGIRSSSLSDRERQVVELIAKGLSNAEIAETLRYAEGTIKADIRHINRLWRVRNRLQVMIRAAELGIVNL